MNISKFTSTYRTRLIISVYKKWIKQNDNVLDVGCGTGVVTKILGESLPIKITGCDVKDYLLYNIPFIKIKNGRIPVKNKTYDVALLNDVLHHVNKANQEGVIKEAARVAKRVLIFEFEPTLVGKLTDVILNEFHYGDLNAPLSQRSIKEWGKLFKSLEFKYEAIKLKKPFWYPFAHIAFMLTKE